MRILIVDDERPARDRLRRMLAQEPGITAVDEARDGIEALEKVASFAPDAIFLDVQMPEVGGLEVAASLPAPAPLVVFATAFDAYAVPAFDANAIDYLLKPFDAARLQRAMQRLRERIAARNGATPPAPALPPGAPLRQLLVTERGVTRVIRVDDIQWLETADNYVILHTAGDAPLLRQTLTDLLSSLGGEFVRCHRRAAVRLALVRKIDQQGRLVLQDGAVVPLGRIFKADLYAALNK
ncbi:response regulator [Pseudoduganella sp. DS3]|uniref:Response regulator n=1 Tax=Pseudoduganella guangdongensis TaxID=2692179 RepID=A0A6N9HIT2_9BURK|nr:response regulator transcription factor [Pseudoduganella guangdongensis]MYN03296.1 response regulator [Pseudoduganella guangdongensis]